jgi:hypothetical protein
MHMFIFSILLLAVSPLVAQVKLDQLMSQDDQQKTGVVNLDASQKSALESWIDQNFTPKPKNEKKSLSLALNLNGGKKLLLSDHSLYEVAPSDVSISSAWLSPIDIQIVPSEDPNYPVRLINTDTGVGVKAKLLSTS